MFVRVALFMQSFDDRGLWYQLPLAFENQILVGQVVTVPIGSKKDMWLVLEVVEEIEVKYAVKEMDSIYSLAPFLSLRQCALVDFIANWYYCKIHQSLHLFFPTHLKNKIKKGKFEFLRENFPALPYSFSGFHPLSWDQQKVFDAVMSSEKPSLLYGVTGSGKTEIYIHLIKHFLDAGKQSLLLVPEIILTHQIAKRIERVFGPWVVVLHSSVSDAKKTKYWESVYSNQARIVVGTRSSLFYPFADLGLIIIDEEHDNSYFSDASPRYDTIELANHLVEGTNTKLLLGSGTPKINHTYQALHGKYQFLQLSHAYQ